MKYHQPVVGGRFSSYLSWPNGVAACIAAEVDPETGFIKIRRTHGDAVTVHPLEWKGMGESGVTGPLGALGSAVENALPHLKLNFNETPLTPNRVWQEI